MRDLTQEDWEVYPESDCLTIWRSILLKRNHSLSKLQASICTTKMQTRSLHRARRRQLILSSTKKGRTSKPLRRLNNLVLLVSTIISVLKVTQENLPASNLPPVSESQPIIRGALIMRTPTTAKMITGSTLLQEETKLLGTITIVEMAIRTSGQIMAATSKKLTTPISRDPINSRGDTKTRAKRFHICHLSTLSLAMPLSNTEIEIFSR